MPFLLIVSATLITLALVFYLFGERWREPRYFDIILF